MTFAAKASFEPECLRSGEKQTEKTPGGQQQENTGTSTVLKKSLELDNRFWAVFLSRVPGASERTPHVRAVEVFTQIHQRKEGAQYPRFQVVRQMQAAGGHAREAFSVLGDELHDFTLAFLWRVAQRRLTPHLRAAALQCEREVQHAEPLLDECRWRIVLASRSLARRFHGADGAEP